MNIGILGSGDVAQALAKGFLERGDAVMLGTRDASKLDAWRKGAGERASVGGFAETAGFGEWIVIATLGTATEDILRQAGPDNFSGKIVIDATNPLRSENGVVSLAYTEPSNGERIARTIPNARVVKAFNTVGNALMVNPDFHGGRGVMFIAGGDTDAKRAVAALCTQWGLGYKRYGRNRSLRLFGGTLHHLGSPRVPNGCVEPRVYVRNRELNRIGVGSDVRSTW